MLWEEEMKDDLFFLQTTIEGIRRRCVVVKGI